MIGNYSNISFLDKNNGNKTVYNTNNLFNRNFNFSN